MNTETLLISTWTTLIICVFVHNTHHAVTSCLCWMTRAYHDLCSTLKLIVIILVKEIFLLTLMSPSKVIDVRSCSLTISIFFFR